MLADERIEQITDFKTEFEKKQTENKFTAKTIYGDINFEGEVEMIMYEQYSYEKSFK